MKTGITLSVLALAAVSSAATADAYYPMTGTKPDTNRMESRLNDRHAAAQAGTTRPGERSFYVAPVVSWNALDSDSGLDDSPGYGVRLGFDMSRLWSAELALDYTESDVTDSRRNPARKNEVALFALSFDGIRRFATHSPITPYALAGIGVVKTGLYANEYDGLALSLGGGVLAPVPNWPAHLRAELKARYTDSDSLQDEDNYIDWILSLGVQFDIGLGARQADTGPNYRVSVAAPEKEIGLDSDGDRVPDQRDRCPNTGPGISVNPRGCEVDTDSDGVVDSKDQCLDTDIGVVVGKVGCALFLDVDDDGVLNEDDKCPNTEVDVYVDRNGCAATAPVMAKKSGESMQPSSNLPIAETLPLEGYTGADTVVLNGVEFEYKSTRLTSRAKQSLQQHIERFRADRNLVAEVAGHTDSKASRAYNQRLSERRAESVRRYLVDSGVNPSQLTTRGYGESQPIASNSTESGKARNRRVELRILSQ